MAGDWIKIEHTLPSKPEVSRIADILGISEDEVVGKLIKLWIWADQHSADGHAVSVTQTTLDRRSECPGLADALRQVGWLEGRDAALSFPNFDRHNGQSAKRRTQATDRKKNARERERSMSRSERDESVTREEKRREESTETIQPAAEDSDDHAPGWEPPLAMFVAECARYSIPAWFAEKKHEVFSAKGWAIGNTPARWKKLVPLAKRDFVNAGSPATERAAAPYTGRGKREPASAPVHIPGDDGL